MFHKEWYPSQASSRKTMDLFKLNWHHQIEPWGRPELCEEKLRDHFQGANCLQSRHSVICLDSISNWGPGRSSVRAPRRSKLSPAAAVYAAYYSSIQTRNEQTTALLRSTTYLGAARSQVWASGGGGEQLTAQVRVAVGRDDISGRPNRITSTHFANFGNSSKTRRRILSAQN